ncbi:membrane protein insertase YidC [Floricoccus penangensis]|uniref:Membrane protein insertase YidC n=1 Tax=Floricoccus penangensis TaxID=1859475 RepID=A0A9Q5NZH1_9LACT|nr:membrane protein insertase YidC [Floricoccus penangensis]OFI46613.1 membrane protein insertase YidC [Floricoccus penangensis]URZ86843.1 membrane protein insertase YidC [Floricoccus penangensis]
MKKTFRRILYSGFTLSALLLLTGCVQTKNGQPTGNGWVYNLLVKPMSSIIEYFANNLGWGYGFAIIGVTILVRLLILPLGLNQAYKASYQQEKMAYLKPVLQPLQDKMKNATTPEAKMAAQQELMQVQKDNGVSMFGGIGCLPLLIQMPFFSALFYAARYTPGIDQATFFGMNLGQRSLVLVGLAGVLYLIQSYLSTIGMPEEQKAQMKSMMIMSPLMIVFMSLSSPAGVTLYWVVGGLFGIIQQLITTFMIKPSLKKRIDREFEENPPVVNTKDIKDVTPKQANVLVQENMKKNLGKNSNRNAGKQNKNK